MPDRKGQHGFDDLTPGEGAASDRELREQAEMDALLRLAAGGLAAPSGLAGRLARSMWHRRIRAALELATAAVIVIGLAAAYIHYAQPPYRLDGQAKVTDDAGNPTRLRPGAWVATDEQVATLRVGDRAAVELAPRTRLQLVDAGNSGRVRLDSGRVVCRTDAGGRIVIETPRGRVVADAGPGAVRVTLTPAGGLSEPRLTVAVQAGGATLLGADADVQLAEGEERSWPPAEPPKVKVPPGGQQPGQGGQGREQETIPSVPVPPGGPGLPAVTSLRAGEAEREQ
ncbi:MAG: hypothetical protein BIFFINMI_04309 [Phycisphaerae bacterium]|nr:hypothetical protein [Phycisphaerae bacterium]